MGKLEKIIRGYDLFVKNAKQSLEEKRIDAYFQDQFEFMKKDNSILLDPWVKTGAFVAVLTHPLLSYKMFKYAIEYKKSSKK